MTTHDFSFGFYVTTASDRRITASRLEEARLTNSCKRMLDRETDIAFNSSVGASLTRGEVDIDLTVDAKDIRAAAPIARDFVIESIRAAGGTPIGIYVFDGEDDRPLRAPEKALRRSAAALPRAQGVDSLTRALTSSITSGD